MILLQNNTVNTFYVTISERSLILLTGGTPYLTISFENQETKEIKNVIPIVIDFNERADKLELIVSGSTYEDLPNGVIHFNTTSVYKYQIYENNNPTLTPTGNFLECGIMMIDNYNYNTVGYSAETNSYIAYGN